MIIEEGAFLAHYGKKGMKWGQRKSNDSSPGFVRKHPKTTAAIGVAGAATLVIGGLAVKRYLGTRGSVSVSSLHKQQLNELDQILNFMSSRTHGPLGK